MPSAQPSTSVVILFTMALDSTEKLAVAFTERVLIHAPEFLQEAHAAENVVRLERRVIGKKEVRVKKR